MRRFVGSSPHWTMPTHPSSYARSGNPFANLLEVHAAAEEAIFYPKLLRRGDDAEDETVDAIGDHNDIRDGVREAARHPIGSAQWWDGIRHARVANSSHMAEEEDDALPDFRRNTPLSVRVNLGHEFLKFKTDHSDAQGLDPGPTRIRRRTSAQ